jgi:23S rRNA G2445 N2-methylase RlmL
MITHQVSGVRTLDSLRLVGAGGTNKVMAGELSRLARRALSGVRLPEPRKAGAGAIVYPFDARVARAAALYHRTSVRVLWDIIETRAARLEPLFDDVVRAGVERVEHVLWDGARISVYAHGVREFAAGERQVVGTVKNGLIEAAARTGMRVTLDPETPDVVFAARLDDGTMRVSVDLAGRPMNQRGYRQERSRAPLREDLAAVLLMLARYDARREILLDPLAGSGTVAIEAACMGEGRPVWVSPRRPLVLGMPAFRGLPPPGDVRLFADTEPCVVASDRDPDMKAIAERSAAAAGVASTLDISTADFRDMTPERVRAFARVRGVTHETGVIVSNPPYGERLDPPDLERLYRDLGRHCARFAGWRAAFLVANAAFERAFGRRPRIKKPLSNGPLRGYFYLYEL